MLLSLCCALLLAGAPADATPQKPTEMKYSPAADAKADLAAALKRAQAEHKVVLLDVGGEWCPWCHRMDKFLTDNAELLDLLQKNFVVVKVNYSDENKNEAFLSAYPKVQGYPHIFVLDATGKLLESKNTGDLEEGKGYNLARFKEFLMKYAGRK